jgi:endogenous inhibitor of DNA gyrase (YacG/DUF329 family)
MPRKCITCGRMVAEATRCPFCSGLTVECIPAHENANYAKMLRIQFERRKRWIIIISSLFVIVTIALCFFSGKLVVYPVVIFFLSFVGSLLFYVIDGLITWASGCFYLCTCPRCKKNIDVMAIGQNVRYCPFCGIDLEEQIVSDSSEPADFFDKECGQRESETKSTDIKVPTENPDAWFKSS